MLIVVSLLGSCTAASAANVFAIVGVRSSVYTWMATLH